MVMGIKKELDTIAKFVIIQDHTNHPISWFPCWSTWMYSRSSEQVAQASQPYVNFWLQDMNQLPAVPLSTYLASDANEQLLTVFEVPVVDQVCMPV